MSFNFRQINENDKSEVSGWFKSNGFIEPSDDIKGSIGVIVEKNDTKCAVGWLLPTTSSICFYEWVQTNPKISVYLKSKSVSALTRFMLKTAKELGFRHLMGFTPESNTSLLKFYKNRLGASIGSKSLRSVYKEL